MRANIYHPFRHLIKDGKANTLALIADNVVLFPNIISHLTVAEELLDRGGHQHDLAAARDRQQEPVQYPEQRVLHLGLLDHHRRRRRLGLRFGGGLAKHCENEKVDELDKCHTVY